MCRESYRPRHPERAVLYGVLFHHFERFLIIRHLESTFAAERPPPSRIFAQVALTEVEGFGDSS